MYKRDRGAGPRNAALVRELRMISVPDVFAVGFSLKV